MKSPLFIALDVNSDTEAYRIVELTSAYVAGYKVGPRLLMKYGPDLSAGLAKVSPLFIDNKYFDIPSTMEASVRATFEAGASFTTVHAQAGIEALTRLAKLERELNEIREFKILAVTVLTSFQPTTLPPVLRAISISEMTLALCRLVIESGLSGIVCSPEEVRLLRKEYPSAFLVTPGIRILGSDIGDQKRVADPLTALQNGASALVVGRPIIEAANPAQMAKQYMEVVTSARPQGSV